MDSEKEILLKETSEDIIVDGESVRERKTKSKKGIIFLGIIGGVVGILVFLSAFLTISVLGEIGGNGRSGDGVITVEVPEGSSATSIAVLLEEEDAIGNSTIFRVYCKLQGKGADFNYGTFEIVQGASYKEIAEILSRQTAFAETKRVVIPEGTGINDYTKNVNGKKVTVPGIATLLENAGVCTKDDFFIALNEVELTSKLLQNVNDRAYEPLEGYLYPDTYDLYFYTAESYDYSSKDCAKQAIEKMLSKTEQVFTDKMYARAKEMGYSVNDILTMASIIQMESGQNSEEMPNVAAVFYNRLNSDAFPTLGSSPTCYYGTFNPDDDGRYDTYKIKGFPPGPLCSPGIDAINAALYPTTKTSYFYFVTDSKGKFYYHTTAAEQDATISRLQQQGNWIYEYFD